jgi:hypothetical protein
MFQISWIQIRSFSGVWFIDTPAQITAEWVPKIEKLYYGIKIWTEYGKTILRTKQDFLEVGGEVEG